MAAMDWSKWNSKYPIGTLVIVTLADRRRRLARTVSAARHIGSHDFVELDVIQPGTVLLAWCWPVKGDAIARLAPRHRVGANALGDSPTEARVPCG
jgi:hypothetical protein